MVCTGCIPWYEVIIFGDNIRKLRDSSSRLNYAQNGRAYTDFFQLIIENVAGLAREKDRGSESEGLGFLCSHSSSKCCKVILLMRGIIGVF